MAVYKCTVCGYVYDEEKEGKPFSELEKCPVCGAEPEKFVIVEQTGTENSVAQQAKAEYTSDLAYPSYYARVDLSCRYMKEIHEMAVTGKTVSAAMGTKMPMPSWDDILILGVQLNPMPLFEHENVNITTVIGKNAKRPMILEGPVYISHMSFGALSKETKIALAKGSAMAKTAQCSGEGGILPEEMAAAA